MAAVLLAAGGVVALTSGGSHRSGRPAASSAPVPDPTPTTPAGKWKADSLRAFVPLNSVLLELLRRTEAWQKTGTGGPALASEITRFLPDVVLTGQELAARPVYAPAPRALLDYRTAVALYLQGFRLTRASTRLPAGALRVQAQRTYRRLIYLADRVFDQASTDLAALDPAPPSNPDVIVNLPSAIPDFAGLGLAAGPPLAAGAASPAPAPSAAGATEPVAAWRAAVGALHVPSAPAVRVALHAGGVQALDTLARALTAASRALAGVPEPAGYAADARGCRLALLVDAEAARVAELARLSGAGGLGDAPDIAVQVAALGDGLWSRLLPPRAVAAGTSS